MLLLSSLALPLLVLFSAAGARPSRHETPAFVPPRPSVPRLETPSEDAPVVSRNGTQLPSYSQTYYFNQLIDHNNPGLGTFKQRYWHTYEFYEPGEFFHSGADAMEHSVLTGNGAFPPQVVRLSFPLREK